MCVAAGTAKALRDAGIPCEMVFKIHEGRPNPVDLMKNGEISLIMLTSQGDAVDLQDGKELRRLALSLDIPTVTTLAGCLATVAALRALRSGPLVQTPIQDYFRECTAHSAAASCIGHTEPHCPCCTRARNQITRCPSTQMQ